MLERAESRWMDARGKARPAGRAARVHGETVEEPHTFDGELVEIRRDRVGIAVATEVRADVLGGDPQDVGFLIPGIRGSAKPRGRNRQQGSTGDEGDSSQTSANALFAILHHW